MEEHTEEENKERGKKRKNRKSHRRTRETRREVPAREDTPETRKPEKPDEKTQEKTRRRRPQKKEDREKSKRQTSILNYTYMKVSNGMGGKGSTRNSTLDKASGTGQEGGLKEKGLEGISKQKLMPKPGTAGSGQASQTETQGGSVGETR